MIIEITTVSKNIFVNPSVRRVDVKIITNYKRMYIIIDSALFRICNICNYVVTITNIFIDIAVRSHYYYYCYL